MAYALNIKNLSKRYSDGLKALSKVSLQVNEGDFFALLGPNGAGKTSLINIITQLNHADEGEVEVFGLSPKSHSIDVKKMVGLVPQEFNFNMFLTVEQILSYSAGYYGVPESVRASKINSVLKRLNLSSKKNVMARFLSGGMKRRLMIARALMHSPRLLLLDEPTAGVDVEIRQETWSFLKELNEKGLTIILTTHYLEEAERLCNAASVLHLGKVRFSGKMRQLLKTFCEEDIQFFFSEDVQKTSMPKYFDIVDRNSARVTLNDRRTLQKVFNDCQENGLHVDRIDVLESRLEKTLTSLSKEKLK